MDLHTAIEIIQAQKNCSAWIAGLMPSNRRCDRECAKCKFFVEPEKRISAFTYVIDTLMRECFVVEDNTNDGK